MFTGLRPFSINSGVKSKRWEDTIKHGSSWLAALLPLVHLMPETGCVGLLATVHVCLSRQLTSDLLSLLNVGHSRLDQLETAFSEGSPQLGSAVLEPDLRERKGARGCRCKLIIDIVNGNMSVLCVCVCVPVFCPRPGPACLPAAPSAGFLDSSSSETQSPSRSPGGNTDTRYWNQPSPCPKSRVILEGKLCSDWLIDWIPGCWWRRCAVGAQCTSLTLVCCSLDAEDDDGVADAVVVQYTCCYCCSPSLVKSLVTGNNYLLNETWWYT